MKKIINVKKLALTLALGSALMLSACGGTPTPTQSPAASQTSTTDATASSSASSDTSAAPSNTASNIVLTVGATSVPQADLLRQVIPDLAAEGITLNVKEFTDYELINPATVDGSLDANYFQHVPYLTNYNEGAKTELVSVGPIHIEPLGIYSKKIKSIADVKDGDTVSIPNDGSNETRALKLIAKQGLITLDPNATGDLTVLNVTENPKNLKFHEIGASLLTHALDDDTLAVINGNYALQANLVPSKDAIILETAEDSKLYANCLVVNKGNENKPEIEALYAALTNDKMRKYITDTYQGSVIPVF